MTGQAGDAPRRLRVRPSGLKGRCAIAPRRPPAALDPGASATPDRQTKGRPGGLPLGGARRSLPDYKITSIRVSTVWGDCQITQPHRSAATRMAGWYFPPPDQALRIRVAIGTGPTYSGNSGGRKSTGITSSSVI